MIELSGVSRTYRSGRFGVGPEIRALDDVTWRVEGGAAVGIVGLNGAGKSTLLKVLLGFIRPTSGSVTVAGFRQPRRYTERHGVAYVPERVAIPRHWRVREAMRAYAMLGDLGADAWQRVDRAIERLGLERLADRKVGTLSKGNLQRLAIAQAILGDRRLMVLDEPTDGLDPVWIAELRTLVAEWRAADARRTLVIASHHLTEIERLTQRVVLLHNGRLEGELTLDGPGGLEGAFLRRVTELEEARP